MEDTEGVRRVEETCNAEIERKKWRIKEEMPEAHAEPNAALAKGHAKQ